MDKEENKIVAKKVYKDSNLQERQTLIEETIRYYLSKYKFLIVVNEYIKKDSS